MKLKTNKTFIKGPRNKIKKIRTEVEIVNKWEQTCNF